MTTATEDYTDFVHIGPGTLAGRYMRMFWQPVARGEDLPAGRAKPARIMGEDFTLYRGESGTPHAVEFRCAHRSTQLSTGWIEGDDLRCIYHGWKYDVDGNILDTPAEPAASMLKLHTKHTAYPCHEANGLVYTYMGPKDRIPLLPDLPWLTAPADHVQVGGLIINDCNWLQMQEANVDSVHTPFLHARAGGWSGGDRSIGGTPQRYRNQTNPPTFDIEPTRWGVRAIIRYPAEDGASFIRTNTFIMPVYTALPNGDYVDGKLDGFTVNVEVPADDYTTVRYSVQVQRTQPIVHPVRDFRPDEVAPGGRKLKNLANDYLIDREKQRTKAVYSGLDASFPIQDACAVESMGPITDRSQEHLGVSDTQVVALRRFLLDAVRGFQEGADPPGVAWDIEDNDFSDLYLVNAVVPGDRPWKESLPDVTTYDLAEARRVPDPNGRS